MTIHVMSRENAIKYSCQQNSEISAVISISDYDKDAPILENNPDNGIISRCKLKFNDVDRGEAHAITDADAHKIMIFVAEIKENVDRLIVHCKAGVSRSAGVAAAIMKAIYNDDREIFNSRRYRPNMTCYRMVLNVFYK